MKISPESLEAFAQAASLGSFSAAARRLRLAALANRATVARDDADNQ